MKSVAAYFGMGLLFAGIAGPPSSRSARHGRQTTGVKDLATAEKQTQERHQRVLQFLMLGDLPDPVCLVKPVSPMSEPSTSTPPLRAESPEALKAEVEAWRAPRVAWRQITWKSCLLEGLKEARSTGRPALLWVFLDRPADDERC